MNYAVGMVGIVLLATGWLRCRKRWVRMALALNLAILGIPAWLLLLVFNILFTGRDAWTEGESFTAPDGQAYVYLHRPL